MQAFARPEEGDGRSLLERLVAEDRDPLGRIRVGRPAKIKALAGHDVYPLTPEQLAAWKKSAEPIVANWEADVSKAGQDPEGGSRRAEKRPSAERNSAY